MNRLILPRRLRIPALLSRFVGVGNLEGLTTCIWKVAEDIYGEALQEIELELPMTEDGRVVCAVDCTGPRGVGAMRLEGRAVESVEPSNPVAYRNETPGQNGRSNGNGHWEREKWGPIVNLSLPYRERGSRGRLMIRIDRDPASFDPLARQALRRLRAVLLRLLPRLESSEDLDRAHHSLLVLLNLVGQFGTHHKSEVVTEKALSYFVRELGFRRGIIALVDDTVRRIYGLDGLGFEDVYRLVRFSYETDVDAFSRTYREKKALFFDPKKDEEAVPLFLRSRQIDCLLALPMRVEEQIIAVMLLEFPGELESLHHEQLSKYQFMADLLGQSLYMSTIYEKLRRTAETDPLTGCFNRLALNSILEEEIPRVKRHNKPLSLLMVDLCDFKKFNDMYSHVVGDRILRKVAKMLIENTRGIDKVVRYGGDEFLVVMPNTSQQQAEVVVRRIERSIRDNNDAAKSEKEMYMLSLGLKCADRHTVDRVLEEADADMYRQKAEQNRTKLFNAFTSSNPEDLKKSDSFVAVLIKNLVQREPHFLDHARKVMLYSQAICQRIGADEETIESVSLAALLHDIGKIALPMDLLMKSEPLNSDEIRQLRLHPTAGSDFLAGHKYLSDLRIVISHHHERWDGDTTGPHPGYPSGLAGEQIPLGSRIIRIAEAYDDLTSQRPYRPMPLPPARAVKVLDKESGLAFDPTLVEVFVSYLEMITTPLVDFGSMSRSTVRR